MAWEMSQLIKYLPHKHEGLSLDFQQPYKSLSTYNLSTERGGLIPGALCSVSLASQ